MSSLCLHQNTCNSSWRRRRKRGLLAGKEEIELRVQDEEDEKEEEEEVPPPSPQDLQYVQEIKRVFYPLSIYALNI